MKKLTAILTAFALSMAVALPANAETCEDGLVRYGGTGNARACYDYGVVVGVLIGGVIVGGITAVALIIHNSRDKPGTVVSFGEENEFDRNSQFFFKPDIEIASDRKIGWNAGIQW